MAACCSVDELVHTVSLHIPRPFILHGYVIPFIILYGSWLYGWLFVYGVNEFYEAGLIGIAAIGVLQILSCLCCHWSVHVQCFFTCSSTKDPVKAKVAKVVPTSNNGSSELVSVHQYKDESNGSTHVWFVFQKTKYAWDKEKKCFVGLQFPVDHSFQHYMDWKGYQEDADLQQADLKYGHNQQALNSTEDVSCTHLEQLRRKLETGVKEIDGGFKNSIIKHHFLGVPCVNATLLLTRRRENRREPLGEANCIDRNQHEAIAPVSYNMELVVDSKQSEVTAEVVGSYGAVLYDRLVKVPEHVKASNEDLTELVVQTTQSRAQASPSYSVRCCINSVIAKNECNEIVLSIPNGVPDAHFSFYMNYVHVTNEDAVRICERTLNQEGDAWLSERRKRITGSICYGLHTYYVNKSPDWQKKIDATLNSKFTGNAYTRYGQANEPKARAAYEVVTGNKVTELGLVVNPRSPWLGCSPDGVVMGHGDEVAKLVEIKCPVTGSTVGGREVCKHAKFMDGRMLRRKHSYYGQVQLGMFLLNTSVCDFVIYSSFDDSVCVTSVPIDWDFLSVMVPRLKEIYFKHMLVQLANKQK